MSKQAREVFRGERFEFGANWTSFLSLPNDKHIAGARASLSKTQQVAKPDGISDVYHARGFQLVRPKTCGGLGCNEYVFVKD